LRRHASSRAISGSPSVALTLCGAPAYPRAAIDITKTEATASSLTTIVAKAEGVRTDLPPGAPAPPDLAVECRFDENILTGFHWTAGPTH
jgi:hypothetical protein